MNDSGAIRPLTQGKSGVLTRFAKHILTHPRVGLLGTLVGMLLTLPCIRAGWVADDLYQRWVLTGSRVFSEIQLRSRLDMFRFLDGDPQRNVRMKEIGLLPWWFSDHVRIAFWKPITSSTHLLDYLLWPTRSENMHLHNLLWFGLLLLATARFYRRLMGRTVAAGMAIVIYAISDVHAIPVAWLANRNSVMAALFGVLMLQAHHRWRRHGSPIAAIAGPVLLAMSLLSAEAGTGILGYLLAYQLTLERSTWKKRTLALIPYVCIVVLWRAAWAWLGYGLTDMGSLYIDPIRQPYQFATAMVTRLPVLLLGQFGYPPADLYLVLPGFILAIPALLAISVSAWCLWPMLRRSRVARFWAIGVLLAAVPISSAMPMNRQLIFICIGACGLLGQFFSAQCSGNVARDAMPLRVRACRWLLLLALIRHLVVSPIMLVVQSRYPLGPDFVHESYHTLPDSPAAAAATDLVIVSHPLAVEMLDWMAGRAVEGGWIPRRILVLAPSSVRLTIDRPDANSLRVAADQGFLTNDFSRLLTEASRGPAKGDSIKLPIATVTVLKSAADGQPTEVLFRFEAALEDASMRWVYWDKGFKTFKLPAVGASIQLPASGRFF